MRNMLAKSSTVQAWLSKEGRTVDSQETALAHIYPVALPSPASGNRYTKDELEGYRPYVLVWREQFTATRLSTTGGVAGGAFAVMFVEDIPAAYLNDLEGSSTQFETAVNGILDELWDDADATAGNLMITGVSIDDGPVRNDYADIPEQGDSHAMLCTVQFGPDV